MIHLKRFVFNPISTCCYVVWDEERTGCAVVDPGMWRPAEREELFGYLDREGLRPGKILLTHGHFDHVLGVSSLMERYGSEVFMHPKDAARVTESNIFTTALQLDPLPPFHFTEIHEGDHVAVGNLDFEVMEVPGHTGGSVAWIDREDRILFSGDTIMKDCIGRTDLPGGEYDDLIRSIMDKIMGLDGDFTLLPGHGSETTVGYEAVHNPFLVPFNEPDTPWWEQDGLSLDGR